MDRRGGDRRRRRSQGFQPTDVANLSFWLRGDTGIDKNGSDAIRQWDFKNGAFRGVSNVAQPVGANKPTHIPVDPDYNGKSTVSFDGNDFLDSGVFSSVLAQPSTFFFVAQFNGAGNQFVMDSADGVERNVLFTSGGNYAFFAGATVSGSAFNNDPHVFEIVFNGASSEMFLDGVSNASGNPAADGLSALRLGANIVPANQLVGKIAEKICYAGVVSSADRTLIRTYLQNRYGL